MKESIKSPDAEEPEGPASEPADAIVRLVKAEARVELIERDYGLGRDSAGNDLSYDCQFRCQAPRACHYRSSQSTGIRISVTRSFSAVFFGSVR